MLEDNATVTADAQRVREFEVNEARLRRRSATAPPRVRSPPRNFKRRRPRESRDRAGAAIGAQASFATTLGLDADAEVVPSSSPPAEAPNPTYAQSLKRALYHPPRLHCRGLQRLFGARNLRYAKLARFPIFTAASDEGVTRQFVDCFSTTVTLQEWKRLFRSPLCPLAPGSWTNHKSIGLNLSIPIYDQGQTNYNVAVAASKLDQAVAALNLDPAARWSPTFARRWQS